MLLLIHKFPACRKYGSITRAILLIYEFRFLSEDEGARGVELAVAKYMFVEDVVAFLVGYREVHI